jgi:hypothetical protein
MASTESPYNIGSDGVASRLLLKKITTLLSFQTMNPALSAIFRRDGTIYNIHLNLF